MSEALPERLDEALASGRVHSGYLLTGAGPDTGRVARRFVRALVCTAAPPAERPCESCDDCRRGADRVEPEIDGTGKRGPLYRHVGDHPDLIWVERGPNDTRVRIGQVRAACQTLGLRGGSRRACVIADASWLNLEAQNALLRALEEPPEGTTFVLLCESAAALLATVRSRCQQVACGAHGEDDTEAAEALYPQFEALTGAGAAAVLEWAEEFRGSRSVAAEGVASLLAHASHWVHHRVTERAVPEGQSCAPFLEAWGELRHCRKILAQRNANPQMVAERALFAVARSLEASSEGPRVGA